MLSNNLRLPLTGSFQGLVDTEADLHFVQEIISKVKADEEQQEHCLGDVLESIFAQHVSGYLAEEEVEPQTFEDIDMIVGEVKEQQTTLRKVIDVSSKDY